MKQFCPKGHDTLIVGRTKNHTCYQCRSVSNKNSPHRKELNWKCLGLKNQDGQPFTTMDFDRLYQIQQGRCAICKRHSSELSRVLNADHDHQTGQVRGLLCFNCNSQLGIYEKWVEINLKSITDYLRR
jgi:hypothetical protein